MADQKLTALTEDTAPTTDDLVYTVTDPAGTPASRKVTLVNLIKGLGGAWTAWTPTLSGRFTDADWTKDCDYMQIGKTVFWRLKLTAADATPMAGGVADATFSLPVTANAGHSGTDQTGWIGGGGIYDSGTATFACGVYVTGGDATTAKIRIWGAGATNVTLSVITSTAPMTWTTSDEITASGSYEAA
jgi:hypothetical protein